MLRKARARAQKQVAHPPLFLLGPSSERSKTGWSFLGETYRSYKVWHEQDEESNVAQNEEKANQGDHIGREP